MGFRVHLKHRLPPHHLHNAELGIQMHLPCWPKAKIWNKQKDVSSASLPAGRGVASGKKLAHKPQHKHYQSNVNWVFPIAIARNVIDESKPTRLIDEVEQRIPIEHGQHKSWASYWR